jgi:mRNA-degrading endonuclease RelE of RelBE toxin-antitoxin system
LAGRILYKSSVRHDLKQIDPKKVKRVLRETRTVLGGNSGSGEALHGEFEGLYKLRVGEYRVIYALIEEGVLVLRIRRRSKAYR